MCCREEERKSEQDAGTTSTIIWLRKKSRAIMSIGNVSARQLKTHVSHVKVGNDADDDEMITKKIYSQKIVHFRSLH